MYIIYKYCRGKLRSVGGSIYIYLNQFIIPIKKKFKDIYEQSVYDKLLALQSNEETKLNIYSRIKTHYKYETYLNLHPYNKIITKFRLSNHYLPIEKGRYVKPKLNRN